MGTWRILIRYLHLHSLGEAEIPWHAIRGGRQLVQQRRDMSKPHALLVWMRRIRVGR